MWKGILYKLPWIRSSFFLVIILLYHPPALLFKSPLPLLGHNFMCYIHFNSQVVSFTPLKDLSTDNHLLLQSWSLCPYSPRHGHGVLLYWSHSTTCPGHVRLLARAHSGALESSLSLRHGMSSMSLTSTRTQSICVPYPVAVILAEGEWGINHHPLTKSEWIKRQSRARYLQNNRRKKLLAHWLFERANKDSVSVNQPARQQIEWPHQSRRDEEEIQFNIPQSNSDR